MNNLTVIMYHYVRNVCETPFPEIKAISVNDFEQQIEYCKKYYTFVTIEDCIETLKEPKYNQLPKNALLLTFDDGYIDHYQNIFPVLVKHNIQGCFFPPVKVIKDRKVLDVNKIHFLLAATDLKLILQSLFDSLDKYKEQYQLKDKKEYFNNLAKNFRLDTKEVIFIKRLLQRELPLNLREKITDELFQKYVTADEASFAEELYLSSDMIKKMHNAGMYFGSHGSHHQWMGTLDANTQETEIEKSLNFLNSFGIATEEWVMCYPFGSYNDNLLKLLQNKNCKMAFTSDVNIATLDRKNALILARLDTMDLPREANAEPNCWTLQLKE